MDVGKGSSLLILLLNTSGHFVQHWSSMGFLPTLELCVRTVLIAHPVPLSTCALLYRFLTLFFFLFFFFFVLAGAGRGGDRRVRQ